MQTAECTEISAFVGQVGDSGEFVCQLQTDSGLEEARQQLSVRVPPSIWPVPSGGLVTARQGETVRWVPTTDITSPIQHSCCLCSLRCNATGVPAPSLAWHKSVGQAAGGHAGCGGHCYTIPRADLTTAGDYLCSAVNGVGHPAHATITLNVLCKCIETPDRKKDQNLK